METIRPKRGDVEPRRSLESAGFHRARCHAFPSDRQCPEYAEKFWTYSMNPFVWPYWQAFNDGAGGPWIQLCHFKAGYRSHERLAAGAGSSLASAKSERTSALTSSDFP